MRSHLTPEQRRFAFFHIMNSFSQAESETCVAQALADGVFSDEILPIELRGAIVSVDDTVRPNVSAEGLAALKPSFPEWGDASTTAGNASGVGDGAALCILTTRARAEASGLDILAKFVGTAIVGVEPRHMGIAPIYAIPKVLDQIGLDYQDIDVYEVGDFYASLSYRLHESRDYALDQRGICVTVRLLR
jgi:acetyl-CoA acyltransferase 1